MTPPWWQNPENRKQAARVILKEVGWYALRHVPLVGNAFELAESVVKAIRQEFGDLPPSSPGVTPPTAANLGLTPAEGAELLMELAPDEARLAVDEILGSPEGRQSTSRLAPARAEQLRARLAAIPADLRSLGRPIAHLNDFNRALASDAPRRFKPGDSTPDGHYRLERFIGAGGFGEVWEGLNRYDGNHYAIKFCIDAESTATLRAEIDSIRHLYQTLGRVRGIVQFYPPNLNCDPPYLVMEYCAGGDALKLIEREGAMSWARCVEVVRYSIGALGRAHGKGLVHRDIKPSNLLIGADGSANLSDFGLARIIVERNLDELAQSARSGRSAVSMGLGVAGTALYMAPELEHGRLRSDDLPGLQKADVYALGVTLAQMLCGEPTLRAGQMPRAVRRALPPSVLDVIEQAVEFRPEDRPNLEQLVRAILITLDVSAPTAPSQASQPPPLPPPAPAPPTPSQRPTPAQPQADSETDAEAASRVRERMEREAVEIQHRAELQRHEEIERQDREAKENREREERRELERRHAAALREKEARRVANSRWEAIAVEEREAAAPREKEARLVANAAWAGLISRAMDSIFDDVAVAVAGVKRVAASIPAIVKGRKKSWLLVIGALMIVPAMFVVDVAQNSHTPSAIPVVPANPIPRARAQEKTFALPGGVPLTLVKMPRGSFQMGSGDAAGTGWPDSDEFPQHQVTIGYDFYMGKFEVTQAQWLAVMGSWPSTAPSASYGVGGNFPAYYVSWNDIQNFEAAINSLGLGGTFRLPSEAEWEYAARGGTQTRFPFGDSTCGAESYAECDLSQYAWWGGNNTGSSGQSGYGSKVVGGKLPNAFGLYDTMGNVWEWCEDWRHGNYTGAPTDGSARALPVGSSRVVRGGFWFDAARYCRPADRHYNTPGLRNLDLSGFRLAWTP